MCRDSQNVAKVFYILCFEVIIINSRTSTLWKLNTDRTKIIEASPFHPVISYSNEAHNGPKYRVEDPLFDIIASTEHFGQSWIKEPVPYYCTSCQKEDKKNDTEESMIRVQANEESLDCGKPVNFTYYDNLVGVLNRNRHPPVPEPQAVLFFVKSHGRSKADLDDFDVGALERRLRKAKREKPRSIQLYNQLGNLWRVKGDAGKAIECFRRALAASPHNAEVLLNLARVLFSLQYLDDAIYLTRRSLEVQPPDRAAWQQYFTLGEILKAYGHYQEAGVHLRHALELRPGFEPARRALRDMESAPAAAVHVYTLVIIVCLVLGVLLVILSSVDNISEFSDEIKPQRHFNKAMAMRSLRGITMTTKRCKKSSTSPCPFK